MPKRVAATAPTGHDRAEELSPIGDRPVVILDAETLEILGHDTYPCKDGPPGTTSRGQYSINVDDVVGCGSSSRSSLGSD